MAAGYDIGASFSGASSSSASNTSPFYVNGGGGSSGGGATKAGSYTPIAIIAGAVVLIGAGLLLFFRK
jgi:hypothetical protein